jgi:hypothetical protein
LPFSRWFSSHWKVDMCDWRKVSSHSAIKEKQNKKSLKNLFKCKFQLCFLPKLQYQKRTLSKDDCFCLYVPHRCGSLFITLSFWRHFSLPVQVVLQNFSQINLLDHLFSAYCLTLNLLLWFLSKIFIFISDFFLFYEKFLQYCSKNN